MNYPGYIIKYTLYFFNIIFEICGILLIVMGSVILSNIHEGSTSKNAGTMETFAIIGIVLGSLVAIVSFLGSCGAIRENIGFMTTYTVFMFVFVFGQVILIIWGFGRKEEFLKSMRSVAGKAWIENDSANGFPMNFLQITFQCCGLHNFTDYEDLNRTIPFSCCGGISSVGICPEEIYFPKPGCGPAFVEFWIRNMNLMRYVGTGITLIEVMAFSFGCYLTCSLRKQYFWYYGQPPSDLWELFWTKTILGIKSLFLSSKRHIRKRFHEI